MTEQEQILYMQARLSREFSERWHKPLREVMEIFSQHRVLEYIEDCFGIFHVQGDDANAEDIENYLSRKGAPLC